MAICGRCRTSGVPESDWCSTIEQIRVHYGAAQPQVEFTESTPVLSGSVAEKKAQIAALKAALTPAKG